MVKPYYQDEWVTIYHGDCREILPDLPKVDLVLTDPPYGINYHRVGRSKGYVTVNYAGGIYGKNWDAIVGDDKPFDPTSLLVFEKLILWGANNFANKLPNSAGWLIWDKKRGGSTAIGFGGSDAELAYTSFLTSVRIYAYLWDGFKRDGEVGKHFHPTQKPVSLMEWCILQAGDVGSILDPYMGSGATLRAAKDLNRHSIGIEVEEKYCEIAAKRCSQSVMELNI